MKDACKARMQIHTQLHGLSNRRAWCALHLQAVRLDSPPGAHAGAQEQQSLRPRPERPPAGISVATSWA